MDNFKVFRNSPTASPTGAQRSSPTLRSNNAPEDDGVEIGLDLITNTKKKLQGSSSTHLSSSHAPADFHPFDKSGNKGASLSFNRDDLIGGDTPRVSTTPPAGLFSSKQDDDAKSHVSVASRHSNKQRK